MLGDITTIFVKLIVFITFIVVLYNLLHSWLNLHNALLRRKPFIIETVAIQLSCIRFCYVQIDKMKRSATAAVFTLYH